MIQNIYFLFSNFLFVCLFARGARDVFLQRFRLCGVWKRPWCGSEFSGGSRCCSVLLIERGESLESVSDGRQPRLMSCDECPRSMRLLPSLSCSFFFVFFLMFFCTVAKNNPRISPRLFPLSIPPSALCLSRNPQIPYHHKYISFLHFFLFIFLPLPPPPFISFQFIFSARPSRSSNDSDVGYLAAEISAAAHRPNSHIFATPKNSPILSRIAPFS